MHASAPSKHQRGFTLIEFVLYIGIAASLLAGVISIFLILAQIRLKNFAIGEVDGAGQQVMCLITSQIRQAASIESPSPLVTADSLVLSMSDSSKNPTVFSIQNSLLSLTQGAGQAAAMLPNDVQLTNLKFVNRSTPNTPGVIEVTFTLESTHPAVFVGSTDYSKNFRTAVSLK